MDDIEIATLVQDSFWTNLVRVEVHGKVRAAKVYSPSNGGKEKYAKDLEFFAKHWSESCEACTQGRLSDAQFYTKGHRRCPASSDITPSLNSRSLSSHLVSDSLIIIGRALADFTEVPERPFIDLWWDLWDHASRRTGLVCPSLLINDWCLFAF